MDWLAQRLRNQHSINKAPVAPRVVPKPPAVVPCPACGASGDDPCMTASGKVKDTWHAKRGS